MMATRVAGTDRRRTGLALDVLFGAEPDARGEADRLPEVTAEGMVSCSSLGGETVVRRSSLVARKKIWGKEQYWKNDHEILRWWS